MNISIFILPTLPSGTYNLSIHTDYRNQVFEFDSNNNNVLWMLVTVRQRFPDLTVSDFTYQVNQTLRGNVLGFSYTVENIGTNPTIGAPWFDRFRLGVSPSSLSTQREFTLYNPIHRSELSVGYNYTVNAAVSIQPRVYGSMYLKLLIDGRNQILEENKANNHIVSAPIVIPPLFPDLEVQNVSIVDSSSIIIGGQDITLQWSVINAGEVIVESSFWYDSIYLNSSQVVDKLADIVVYNGNDVMLQPQMTYHQRQTVTLPLMLDYSLTYNLVLRVNSRGHIDENNRLMNNPGHVPLVLSAPPSPDLQVTKINHTYFPSSRVLTAQWSVRNIGNSMGSLMTWRDQVFLSSLPRSLFNPAGGIILGHIDQSLRLQAKQVYTLRDSFLVPSTISGQFYVYVVTDVSNSVMEIDGEENNFLGSNSTLTFAPLPTVTLEISLSTDTLPSSYFTGQTFAFEYSIMNTGAVALRAASWVDGIYLSNVANPSRSYLLSDAFPLMRTVNSMQLDVNGTYTVARNITIPYQITGRRFLAVLVDINNVLDIEVAGRIGILITIEQGGLPDLTVRAISRNLNITSGQPAVIEYSVMNEGEAEATGLWYEALILSLDAEIDPFDARLRTVRNPALEVLRVNESYNQSIEVFIPYDLPTSYYYIFIVADTRNDLYEESVVNNQDFVIVSITETVSTDIAIVDVQVSPARITYKNTIAYSWRIRNNGSLRAIGYKCDSIYLSTDDTWDLSDFEFGMPQCNQVTLNAFGNNQRNERSYQRSAIAPFIAQREYYGLVRTRTNIRDPNLGNNVRASSSIIEINAPEITLGRPTTVSLEPGDTQVFRIQGIPGGETLLATLTTEQFNVYHDLFLRHKQAPTGAQHDAFSQFSLSPSQRAVVRHSRSGDYYLRIESFTNSDITENYDVQVLVKLARFEILGIVPTTAAPLGNATLKISGTVLGYFTSASLVSSSNDDVVYLADKMYWFSSESVYATFNLAGAELGEYSIHLLDEKTGSIAQLNNSFAIATGIPGRLEINLQAPRGLRVGQMGDIHMQVQNFGNTDLLTPHLILSGVQTRFRLLDDYNPINFSEQIDFLGLPLEGPGGILCPGASTQITFRAAQIEARQISARFSIKIQNNGSAPHAYMNKKSSLQPNFIPADVWDKVWENFIESVGTNQQTFQQRLSELATEFSLLRKRAYSVQELVEYQLKIAYGLLSGMFSVLLLMMLTYSAWCEGLLTLRKQGKGMLAVQW